MATHSSTLAWKIPWTEELCSYSQWGGKELDTTARLHFTTSKDELYLIISSVSPWHFSSTFPSIKYVLNRTSGKCKEHKDKTSFCLKESFREGGELGK